MFKRFNRLCLSSALVIILLSGYNCLGQELTNESEISDISHKFSLNKDKENNLTNFPFQFGVELGRSIRINQNDDFTKVGIIVYMDLSLYNRVVFFRIEGGKLVLNDEVETKGEDHDRSSAYAFAGLNIKFLKLKRNSLFFSIGLGAVTKGFLPFWTTSLRYVFAISRFIGITSVIKYPFIRGYNPYLSIGIQLFNN